LAVEVPAGNDAQPHTGDVKIAKSSSRSPPSRRSMKTTV